MPITSITITQTNDATGASPLTQQDSILLPVHSPLAFIADVDYTGDAPDTLGVNISQIQTDPPINYGFVPNSAQLRAVFFEDSAPGIRRFVFLANDILKAWMPNFADVYQANNTMVFAQTSILAQIRFFDFESSVESESINVYFYHGARQYSENASAADVYGNEDRIYYAKHGSHVYVYFFNLNFVDTPPYGSADISENGVPITTANNLGRGIYKYKTTAVDGKVIRIQNLSGQTLQATIKTLPECENGLEVKFLDRNGFYRFFAFNSFYEISGENENIGDVLNYVTDIKTAGGFSRSVGYDTKRMISATASDVDADLLEWLNPIYSSPMVMMRNGAGDTAGDWVQVKVSGADLLRRRKGNGGSIDIEFEIPKINNVTLI